MIVGKVCKKNELDEGIERSWKRGGAGGYRRLRYTIPAQERGGHGLRLVAV